MKLLDYSGLQRFLAKIKTLLDSKANAQHTHSTSDVTDLLSDQHTWSSQQSYNADLNLNYSSTDVDDIIDTLAGSYTAEDFLAQNNVWTGDNTFTADVSLQGGIYAQNYYLGTTAFGDIVTHNASEFLTSHQSLSNYVTLDGAQTISGVKTFSGLTKTAGKTEQSSPSDLNDALYNIESYSWGTSTTNKPSSSYGILLNLNREGNVHSSTSNGWRAQLGVGTDTRLYLRTKANTGGEWSAWKEFLTSHQSLSNYVTLNGSQTISATKTWTKSQSFKNTAITNHKENPTADTEIWACQFWSNDNKYWGGLGHKYLTTGFSEVQLCMSNWTTSGSQGYWHLDFGAAKDFSSVYFRPSGDNNCYLGTSDKKWANVYATTFTGNLTGNVTGNVTGNCSGSSGSCTGNAATSTQFSANTTVTLTGDATGTSAGSKKGWSVPVTLANSGVTAGSYGPTADVTGNNNATISVPQITVDAKGRVTSVTNRTLTCKNNTYSVYNKTLTIQKNGTNVATFTSNSNTDVTANITVPTKTSELTNNSGFLTSHQSLDSCVKTSGDQDIAGDKRFTSTGITLKNSGFTVGTKPSANRYWTYFFADSANAGCGRILKYVNKDGSSGTEIQDYKYNNASTTVTLKVGFDSSGNAYSSSSTTFSAPCLKASTNDASNGIKIGTYTIYVG